MVVGAAVVVVANAFATAPIAPSMSPKPNLSWAFLSAMGEAAARPMRAGKRRTKRISMPACKDPNSGLLGLYRMGKSRCLDSFWRQSWQRGAWQCAHVSNSMLTTSYCLSS